MQNDSDNRLPRVGDTDVMRAMETPRSFGDAPMGNAPVALADPLPPPRDTSTPRPSPPNQIDQTPTLPPVVAAVPKPANAPMANPFATSMNTPPDGIGRPPQQRRSGGAKRFFGWLMILAVLGGAIAAGVVYGPELMTLASGDTEPAEPDAPLVFPVATSTAPTVRTATFTVEQPAEADGPEAFDVTVDFETGISKIVIADDDAADIEMLTVFGDALIRRVDDPAWYRLDRGSLSVDGELNRANWIRTLDDFLPPQVRSHATIDDATDAVVENETMRHLVVSIDPVRLRAVATPEQNKQAAAPTAEPAGAPTGPAVAAEPVPTLPPGLKVEPGTDPVVAVTVEMWIDDSGTIRKLALPDELGGQTVTITSMSPDPWQPQFPADDAIGPLTASALLDLGL